MRIKNLTVAARLGLGFGLVLVLILAVAGNAFISAQRLDAVVSDIAGDKVHKTVQAYEWQVSLTDSTRQMRNLLLVDTPEQTRAVLDELSKGRKYRAGIEDELNKTVSSEAGKAALKGIVDARAVFRGPEHEFQRLAEAGDIQAARKVLMGSEAAQRAYANALAKFVETQRAQIEAGDAEADAVYTSSRNIAIGLAAVAFVLGIGTCLVVSRSLLRQLGGDPAVAADVTRAVADGNLANAVELRHGDTASLMAQLQAMQAKLGRVVGKVRGNAESVATASAQIAAGNIDLSARTEQQASALQETAASMEQLGSTVRRNADSARQANQLALGASSVAVRGGEVVGQVVDTMKGINNSSRKIADIIGVIDGIAFQTNILALNAAVEAARAGEQGRGFAVVASEVRSLAQRSAGAAKEIKDLISTSVNDVARGTELVDQAGATMTEIVEAIQRVTDIVAEITEASAEQNAGVAQIGEAVSQMDKSTQQNAALVEQSAAAAESLKLQAQQLVEAVAMFRLGGAH